MPTVPNAQHDPQEPWSLGVVTAPSFLQSTEVGSVVTAPTLVRETETELELADDARTPM